MNHRIKELAEQSGIQEDLVDHLKDEVEVLTYIARPQDIQKIAELIVEEIRGVLSEEYRKTPLECCGHFLRADEAIAKHFYGVK